MVEYSVIYITTKDVEEARRIAQELINSRLVACANIFDGIESLYRWEGKICNDKESVIIAKSKTILISRLIEKVKSIHSYTCPCIIALPIEGGNPPFLDWIGAETQST